LKEPRRFICVLEGNAFPVCLSRHRYKADYTKSGVYQPHYPSPISDLMQKTVLFLGADHCHSEPQQAGHPQGAHHVHYWHLADIRAD
jgi:hypothetical protein